MCRHCEERSDEAISNQWIGHLEIASFLAMTEIFECIRDSLGVVSVKTGVPACGTCSGWLALARRGTAAGF